MQSLPIPDIDVDPFALYWEVDEVLSNGNCSLGSNIIIPFIKN
jgi:hypothetical protein